MTDPVEVNQSSDPQGTVKKRRLPVVLPFVVLVVVIGGAAYLYFDRGDGPVASPDRGPIAAPEGADVVDEFTGEGDDQTPEFEVSEGWQIRWETTGQDLELDVVSGGASTTVLQFSDGPNQGVTSPSPDGTVRIDVTADGEWRLIVVNGEEGGTEDPDG